MVEQKLRSTIWNFTLFSLTLLLISLVILQQYYIYLSPLRTCPDNEGVLSVTRLSNDCEGFLNALQTTLSSLCVSLCHSNEGTVITSDLAYTKYTIMHT